MAADMHTEEYRPLRDAPAPRPWAVVSAIISTWGSPTQAAFHGRITSEEYLMATQRELH
jgi:hypothetical protein